MPSMRTSLVNEILFSKDTPAPAMSPVLSQIFLIMSTQLGNFWECIADGTYPISGISPILELTLRQVEYIGQ